MSGRISDFIADKWLRDFERCYVAIHYDNPEVAGAYASEVFGGGYARVPMTMSSPSNRAIWNSNGGTFSGLNVITVTHLACWDVAINGNYMASVSIPPTRVLQGRGFTFAQGQIAISLD